jgi:hypothetical protein
MKERRPWCTEVDAMWPADEGALMPLPSARAVRALAAALHARPAEDGYGEVGGWGSGVNLSLYFVKHDTVKTKWEVQVEVSGQLDA